MPLFLSDPDGEPDPREFSMPSGRGRRITARILAVVLAASAAAVTAAVFQSDVARVLIANARASMGSAMAEQPAAPPPSDQQVAQKAPTKDPARVTRTNTLASNEARDGSAQRAPSREAIATAYQSALQSQAPAAAPAPAPAPVPMSMPAKTLDADTLATLMNRAKSLIAVGDIAPARLLLERAANAQDAAAAFLLAETYDPAVLGTRDIRSITPDPAMARNWYQKAARFGSTEAQARLAQLQN